MHVPVTWQTHLISLIHEFSERSTFVRLLNRTVQVQYKNQNLETLNTALSKFCTCKYLPIIIWVWIDIYQRHPNFIAPNTDRSLALADLCWGSERGRNVGDVSSATKCLKMSHAHHSGSLQRAEASKASSKILRVSQIIIGELQLYLSTPSIF